MLPVGSPMKALLRHLDLSLRLHFRNRMALLYSYLFPTIFLVAFWVLYRNETVPLVRHVGELLTVTALGGACFGLPTAMVADRERGVLRRFRLAPIRTWSLITTTVVARYLLLLTAGLLQIGLAMAVFGMPAPLHPLDLLLAFTFVAFAFLGLGLVIAMTADNVPAVQALGQCIFLPMLIIGGVAVRIESLPAWAQQLSAYFPGRYAVEVLQVSMNGDGLGGSGFAVLALLLIGAAACLAGIMLFRWDQEQRFARMERKGWLAVALVAWVGVGALAQGTGRVALGTPAPSGGETLRVVLADPLLRDPEAPISSADMAPDIVNGTEVAEHEETPTVAEVSSSERAAETDGAGESERTLVGEVSRETAGTPEATTGPPPTEPSPGPVPEPWRAVTMEEIESLDFSRLPPDDDVVTPVASLEEPLHAEGIARLQCMRTTLLSWPPAAEPDPVQRTRNLLYVAAVPDMFQMEEVERWTPLIVFGFLQATTLRDELMKSLYWIALHPDEGNDLASTQLRAVCLDVGGPSDVETLRERTRLYALKLLGRMTGAIQQR